MLLLRRRGLVPFVCWRALSTLLYDKDDVKIRGLKKSEVGKFGPERAPEPGSEEEEDEHAFISAQFPDVFSFDPSDEHQSTLIWLHGKGDHAKSFFPVLEMTAPSGMRIVMPEANTRHMCMEGGDPVCSWFELFNGEFTPKGRRDMWGLEHSKERLFKILDREIRHVPSDHVILGGFGMGGAMAVYTGVQYPKPLRALVSIGGYAPHVWHLCSAIHESNRGIPLLAAHGEEDTVVSCTDARKTYTQLKKAGVSVDLRITPEEGHMAFQAVITHLGFFLHDMVGK